MPALMFKNKFKQAYLCQSKPLSILYGVLQAMPV